MNLAHDYYEMVAFCG